jgi:hypothetical protein
VGKMAKQPPPLSSTNYGTLDELVLALIQRRLKSPNDTYLQLLSSQDDDTAANKNDNDDIESSGLTRANPRRVAKCWIIQQYNQDTESNPTNGWLSS